MILVLLLTAEVIRNAAVLAFTGTRPDLARKFWSGHPTARIQDGMTQIALAARMGRPVSPSALSNIYAAAVEAPLAPEPFLVRGVQAHLAGNSVLPQRAFLAAEWRDGRSLPARYFLADDYFHRGDARRGLVEIAVLGRLVPEGTLKLAPYVASYARDPANWPELRRIFAADPGLENASLAVLASDPRNLDAILALASSTARNPKSSWFNPLVQGLIVAGDFQRARQLWANVSRIDLAQTGLLFDPRFSGSDAPPPFNWSLASSSIGLAEEVPGRGLHLIYYGHEEGWLASQMLLLPAGNYAIKIDAPGFAPTGGALKLFVTCQGSSARAAAFTLEDAVGKAQRFAVSNGCPAQRLELSGSVNEMAQQRETYIRAIQLERVGA